MKWPSLCSKTLGGGIYSKSYGFLIECMGEDFRWERVLHTHVPAESNVIVRL